ncbi:hypothetical protein PV08_07756 [Exophiala spinifera]|uniref:F-box domain-containing protein n=1 Tax=Exophiala spinifera TaxID=91928 RepID=A0A0D2BUR9_9EURO|nr:uncharacterized protein PV08_07756 [Exophiala spinifera]KIW14969.1 hypothetical protein PV08_07756 [Exophiala spinifera]
MSGDLADDDAVARFPESHGPSHLTTLPDEVLQQILSYLPPLTTVALQHTCRRFAHTANEPLLWKRYCQQCRRWSRRHNIQSKLRDTSFTDWKSLYASRYLASQTTRNAIGKMVAEEVGRLDSVKEILDLGIDAKEELLHLYRNAASSPNHLAQKYWSHGALGCLNRFLAADEWTSIVTDLDTEEVNAFERPIAALDLFVLEDREQGDIDDIFERLDSYVSSVRDAHPDIDTKSPRAKASIIAGHLLQNNWVGIQGNRNYHSIDHMFLGVALFSENRNSVPLISAVIYCYVARHFGLQAAPCSYPYHVHALVQPPSGMDLNGNPLPESFDGHDGNARELTHLYMDPFNTAEPISYSMLVARARFVAPSSSASQIESYLSPSSAQDLVTRTCYNILSSPSHFRGDPVFPVDGRLASYAALFALTVLPPRAAHDHDQFGQHLRILTRHFFEYFDLDVHLFEAFVLPLTRAFEDARAYRNLIFQIKEADHELPPPKYRSDPRNEGVKYRVGQVFRHRIRGYHAVIYGWDAYCKMQEQWITHNQVDRLSNGRHQPFYNVLVDDKSTRYVAEENVVLLSPDQITDEVLNSFSIEIGKWFKRYDAPTGTFVSNVRHRYPDD